MASKFIPGSTSGMTGSMEVYAADGISPNSGNVGIPLYNSNLNSVWPKLGELNLACNNIWVSDCIEFELEENQNEYSALLFQSNISTGSSPGKEIRMDKVRFTCELKIMRDIQADYVSGGLFNFTPILN
ncbi:MAG: hypothetical protein IPN29_20625 [Saprospiraceae bacterium]|nr:hypothetical protein [Saprospiraceae bacterium]